MTQDAGSAVELIAPLRADPARTALLFDFDGTLSPTVTDPAAARPATGATGLLADLVGRYRTVAVVSGRPITFLAGLVPDGVVVSGQYGLERRDADGVVTVHAGVDADAVRGAEADLLADGLPAEVLEPKGLTLTVHYRNRPEDEARIRTAVDRVAGERDLAVHDAKQSVELRPHVEVDKGSEVRDLAAGATAVLYVGDDVGDLPAFAAVRALAATGIAAATVGVDGPELPAEVRAAVDVTVDGTAGVVELLARLAADA